MLPISVRQIEYVIAVARYGSVTTAAKSINISQPALSVALVTIEAHLGQPLFIRRKGSPLALTSFGRDFVKKASAVIGQLEELLQPSTALSQQNGSVEIGCFEDLGPLLIGPLYSAVQKRYPALNLMIKTGNFETLTEQMLTGQIDFAITYDLGMDAIFETREIARINPHILTHPAHRINKLKQVSLKDIAREPLILVDQKHSIRHITGLFRHRQLSANIAYRAATLEIMRSMVANQLGIGISYTRPRSSVSYDGKKLIEKVITDTLSPEPIVIASNRSNPLSPLSHRIVEDIALMQDLF